MRRIAVRRVLSLFWVLVAAFNWTTNAASPGTLVDLRFNSLPSSQGWTYEPVGNHSGDPEPSIFNVSETALNQTSFGKAYGAGTPGHAIYRYSINPGSIAGQSLFELVWESSISAHQSLRPDLRFGPFFVSAHLFGDSIAIGVTPSEVGVRTSSSTWASVTPVGFDGTMKHQYRALIDTDANSWQLFVDGAIAGSGSTVALGGDFVAIGDGTGTGNADGQTTQLTLSIVPEPTTFTLVGLVSLALVMARRRR